MSPDQILVTTLSNPLGFEQNLPQIMTFAVDTIVLEDT